MEDVFGNSDLLDNILERVGPSSGGYSYGLVCRNWLESVHRLQRVHLFMSSPARISTFFPHLREVDIFISSPIPADISPWDITEAVTFDATQLFGEPSGIR